MIANPVLHKELLLRFRFRQAKPALLGIALAVLIVLAWLHYWLFRWLLADPAATTGQTAWQIVVSVQFILLCLVAPSITANCITQEKEQQTWEMLIFTRLMPSEIIIGKLIARMVALTALLSLFLPVSLFCWAHSNFTGTSPSTTVTASQFCITYLVLLICGLFFATFGLFASYMLKRTLYAIMASYTFVIGGLCIATALITGALSSLFQDYRFWEKCPLMWFNPVQIIAETLTLNQPNSSNDPLYLVFGLVGYLLLTLLMLWRMIAGFRRFAYE